MRRRKFYGMLLFIAGVLFAFSAAVTAQSGDDLDPTTDSPDAAVSWEWLISTSSESDLDLTLANPGDKALVEQTVNGYTVRIINVKRSIERKFGYSENGATDVQAISVDVCYSMPDIGEWHLEILPLMPTSDFDVPRGWEGRYNYWNEKKADGKETGEKCARYTYAFALETKIGLPITIEISKLWMIPYGGYDACWEMKERFETNPRAREAGITIHCTDIPTGVPDGMEPLAIASVHLDGYDESRLTKQEAHRLMLEIESGVIYGPWVFTIDSLNTDESQL
mgnify:FL=1